MPTETHHYIDKRAAKVATEIAAGGDPDELLSTSELAEITGLRAPNSTRSAASMATDPSSSA